LIHKTAVLVDLLAGLAKIVATVFAPMFCKTIPTVGRVETYAAGCCPTVVVVSVRIRKAMSSIVVHVILSAQVGRCAATEFAKLLLPILLAVVHVVVPLVEALHPTAVPVYVPIRILIWPTVVNVVEPVSLDKRVVLEPVLQHRQTSITAVPAAIFVPRVCARAVARVFVPICLPTIVIVVFAVRYAQDPAKSAVVATVFCSMLITTIVAAVDLFAHLVSNVSVVSALIYSIHQLPVEQD
jgi:hypothetical protein